MGRRGGPLLTALVMGACAPGAGSVVTATADEAAAVAAAVPPGHGTLRQDDISVTLRSGSVLLKVTPLDEATIRLLAPDTYDRLSTLRDSRAGLATSVRVPEAFLVSFFSFDADAAFEPADVQLIHQTRLLRAAAVLPITPGWGRQRLSRQETQASMYVFDGPIDYGQPFLVRYGGSESDEWRRIIARLELERARVRARVR